MFIRVVFHQSLKEISSGNGDGEVVQQHQGLWFYSADDGGKDVFVHISAVERAGLSTLAEGAKVSFDLVADRRSGKSSAGNLRVG